MIASERNTGGMVNQEGSRFVFVKLVHPVQAANLVLFKDFPFYSGPPLIFSNNLRFCSSSTMLSMIAPMAASVSK